MEKHKYLDTKQVAEVLTEMGFRGRHDGPVTDATVKKYAVRGVLPFFIGPDGRHRIQEKELHLSIQKMQYDAVKSRGR